MKKYICALLLLSLATIGCTAKTEEVKSPNGNIRLAFNVGPKGGMTYQVWVGNTLFISPSALGFEEKSGKDLATKFCMVSAQISHTDETWTQPWGENKQLRNNYNQMAVRLKNTQGTQLAMTFRVFDDGIGFRYEYDVPKADSLLLTDELTTFNLGNDGTSWSIPANFETYE